MKTSEELKEEYNNGPKLRYFIGGVFGFFALFLIILGGNFSLLSFGDFFLLFIISAPIGYGIWALNDKFRYKEFQIQYAKALKRERKKETKKQRAKRLAQEKADQKEREREWSLACLLSGRLISSLGITQNEPGWASLYYNFLKLRLVD